MSLTGPLASPASAEVPRLQLSPCRLDGLSQDAWCGQLPRPLDPARPQGPQIRLQVAVLPALARNKQPDAVLALAGGPGQSAVSLAAVLARQHGRLLNRRDLVLIDQRGTGGSAPLYCAAESPTRPLAEQLDTARQQASLLRCLKDLQALPHGDLRFYTTAIASADVEAVRQALGLGPLNLIGVSYGTRAALDYLRQYPRSVRRVVLDGVAPPDMALTQSFAPDAQAALDALWAQCQADAACGQRHPGLHARWQAWLATLPRRMQVSHPVTGALETLSLDRASVANLLRAPLYLPWLAAALPAAMEAAMRDQPAGLIGLAAVLGGAGDEAQRLAMGMHFSVVCAEDMPRPGAADSMAPATRSTSPDFGDGLARLYQGVCAHWPRGAVPPAFYQMLPSPVPVLLLSGGADPVTPPRHGAHAAQALGPKARHLVAPQAGHGVLGLPCLRELAQRFITTPDDAQALAAADALPACAAALPRPPVYQPLSQPVSAPPTR